MDTENFHFFPKKNLDFFVFLDRKTSLIQWSGSQFPMLDPPCSPDSKLYQISEKSSKLKFYNFQAIFLSHSQVIRNFHTGYRLPRGRSRHMVSLSARLCWGLKISDFLESSKILNTLLQDTRSNLFVDICFRTDLAKDYKCSLRTGSLVIAVFLYFN